MMIYKQYNGLPYSVFLFYGHLHIHVYLWGTSHTDLHRKLFETNQRTYITPKLILFINKLIFRITFLKIQFINVVDKVIITSYIYIYIIYYLNER